MNEAQLIKIAKSGFPKHVQLSIKFNNCKIHHHCGVYRLYDKDVDFVLMIPREYYLAIFIGADNFIQITCDRRAFNHYAAIKMMESLGLV